MEKISSKYFELSLEEVVHAVQKGTVSCETVCSFYLGRIQKFGLRNGLNCVFSINENALEEAKKIDSMDKSELPFAGLMVLVKDNIDVKGMATTAGSIALKDNLASQDAGIIKVLRQKGAVILGKTNMTEFANFLTKGMPGGYSSLGGQVINAYDKKKSPSGSSSGSAVAMSARLCSFSVGTDTSFSVVGCATENGVVGFKPSVGTLPTDGIIPITHYFDNIGFFTSSVKDMVYIYETLFYDSVKGVERNRSILVNDFNSQMVSAEQLERYHKILLKLRAAGYEINHIEGENTSKLKELMLRCFAKELQGYLEENNSTVTIEQIIDEYSSDMEQFAPYGIEYLKKSYENLHSDSNDEKVKSICEDIKEKRKKVLEELERQDACLITGPTAMCHYVGVPSISIPFVTDIKDGFPRSMILYAKNETELLDIAKVIDELKEDINVPKCVY